MATTTGETTGESSTLLPEKVPRATSIIVIGMAGSGKSTFTSALEKYHRDREAGRDEAMAADAKDANAEQASAKGKTPESADLPPYFVNLDPAVAQLRYSPNVDIRDTIDYQRLMEEYNLGPNGGILTALNLFTTKFDQVLGILEKRSQDVDHIILDTPGQIEIFTWSASGTIITDALASAMPTVVAYVIDTPRTLAPATFMSNMLYACSIMYKTRLPFIVVFNKIDVQRHDFALKWMDDFEEFQKALKQTKNPTDPIDPASQADAPSSRAHRDGDDGTYMNSLMNSMALVLDEFYRNLRTVGVSSTTQEGISDFFAAVQGARQEYLDDYRPELEKIVQERADKRQKDKRQQLARMMKDMRLAKQQPGADAGEGASSARDAEDEDIDNHTYEGDGQIMDPDTDEERLDDDDDGGAFATSGTHVSRDGTAWPRQFGDI